MTSNAPEPVAPRDMLEPVPPASASSRDRQVARIRLARIRQIVPDLDVDRRQRIEAARCRLDAGAYADPELWRHVAERMLGVEPGARGPRAGRRRSG